MHDFAHELWPINRSLTGEGNRKTLEIISRHIPNLKTHSIPSKTKVFDWEVPKEWSVKEAFIITPNGQRICDFSKNNLHLIGYSAPFKGKLELNELKKRLHTLPEQPNAIPYITSYYNETWGFCLTQDQFDTLEEGSYTIIVDTNLFDGELNFGEFLIKGQSSKEIFLSTYICHPSMANNELSGPVVVTYLAKWLMEMSNLHYSYRIVFVPETIGAIVYIKQNLKIMKQNIFAGFNVTCIGDNRAYSYLPSRNGKTISDIVAKHVLKWTDANYSSYSWFDRGSDERQYCAPGIDLPIASIQRTRYGEYPEYHTSLDNLEDVVTPEGLFGGYSAIKKAIKAIEKNIYYKVNTLCEPQMGKRGLYPTIATQKNLDDVRFMMNFISVCDGNNSLIEIAELLEVPIWNLYKLADKLHNLDVIKVENI